MKLSREDGCIRYLMKEMDPSEEKEFERMMTEDEDLLIEVESLRLTHRKLNQLPLKTPPEQITQNVLNDAKKLQSSRKKQRYHIPGKISGFAVAASVLITLFAGSWFLMPSDTPAGDDTLNANSAATVNPWVDRNEVIRFAGSPDAGLDAEMAKSMEKLRPVDVAAEWQGEGSPIQYTGSEQ